MTQRCPSSFLRRCPPRRPTAASCGRFRRTVTINRPRQEDAAMPPDVNAARLHRFVRGRSSAVVAPLDDRRPVGGGSSYRAAAAVASIFFNDPPNR